MTHLCRVMEFLKCAKCRFVLYGAGAGYRRSHTLKALNLYCPAQQLTKSLGFVLKTNTIFSGM